MLDKELNFDLDQFEACIICAGLSDIEYIESNSSYSRDVNVISTIKLIKECKKKNLFLLYLSSVAVFDGRNSFYKTNDARSPFNNYGKFKLEVEQFIESYYIDNYVILRLTKVISNKTPLIQKWLKNYYLNKPIIAFEDKYISPISLEDVFRNVMILFKDRISGIYHLGGANELSFYEFAIKFFSENNLSNELVKPNIFNKYEQIYNGKFSSLHNSFQ